MTSQGQHPACHRTSLTVIVDYGGGVETDSVSAGARGTPVNVSFDEAYGDVRTFDRVDYLACRCFTSYELSSASK